LSIFYIKNDKEDKNIGFEGLQKLVTGLRNTDILLNSLDLSIFYIKIMKGNNKLTPECGNLLYELITENPQLIYLNLGIKML